MSETAPHSPECEMGVLSSMMLAPATVIAECATKARPDWFYIPANRSIYIILLDRWEKNLPVDLINLTQHLSDTGMLESIGGASHITNIATFVPTAAYVNYYLDTLYDKYVLRQIIAWGHKSVSMASEGADDPVSLLTEIEGALSGLGIKPASERKTLQELVQDKIERMERGEESADIIKTGITKLDQGSPLRNKNMVVISGERKAGKTILALTIARNVASQGVPVAYMSLESSSNEAVDRLLSGISRISTDKQNSVTNLSEYEIRKSVEAASTLSALPLSLYDDILDLHHIIAEARRLRTQGNLGLLIVDYLQLVRTSIQKDRNREQEVAAISRAIRLLALELSIPILALSQLNEDGRSRESRAIEQDCSAMWKFMKDEDDPPALRRIHIPFQRNGESNVTAQVTFLGNIARIENYAPENQAPEAR